MRLPARGFQQDLLFATRQIRKRPAFAITAIVILALGIGSSVAVFTLLYNALLKPLPYPDSEQLVFIHNLFPKTQVTEAGVSSFDYAQIARRKEVFSSAGAYYYNDLTLTGFGPARHVDLVNASATLFAVFGVRPQVGRTFGAADDRYGAPSTVILSDHFWRSAFSADPHVQGRTLRLDGALYTVIGVMPPTFVFPSPETEMWVPLALRPGSFTLEGGRIEKWLHMVARRASHVTLQQANAALRAEGDALGLRWPAFYPVTQGWHFAERAVAEEQTVRFRRWLYLAWGAVFAVLLIACINVSGLLLIQATSRQIEIAVRLALGATRARIVRQMLTETLLLTALGSIGGIVLALWLLRLVNLYALLPISSSAGGWTLLFAVLIALLSTACAGLLPSLLTARLGLEQSLRRGLTRASAGGSGWQNAIVAAQIAVAVTLLFTATALTRSFLNMMRVPAGFDSVHVWSGAVDLPTQSYAAADSGNTRFFEPLLAALRALPEVESASGTTALPFNPSGVWTGKLSIPSRILTHPPPQAQIGVALPDYFQTMRIALTAGRTFTERDRGGAPLVAIIDQELARRYFPNENPLGKQIGSGGANHTATIIGVVHSVHNSDLSGPAEPQIYFPELQERNERSMYLVLRTRGNDPSWAVRSAVAKLNPAVALYDVHTMEERVAASLRLRKFVAALLACFAFVGLLLASTGLYASLAHLVELRRREIGIRVALGALRSHVIRLVLVRSAAIAGLGVAVGLVGALLAGRAVRSQLFGTELGDGALWATVLLLSLIPAGFAAWWPARRASLIDPSVALREE